MKSFATSGAAWRAVCLRSCAAFAVAGALVSSATRAAPSKGRVADDHAHITFTGFDERTDGASRLYVKLSRPVTVQETLSGTHLEYLMVGATIPIRNNENPLITRHFGAQVVSARLVPERAEKPRHATRGAKTKARTADEPAAARLLVETREPVKPAHRVVRNPDGSAVLIVEFPKPSKPPPPEPDVIAPPPKAARASQVVPVD